MAHRSQVNSWIEPTDRDLYQVHLLSNAMDPAALASITAYVQTRIQASDRGPAEAVASRIAVAIKARAERLPQIDDWLRSPPPGNH